MSKDLIEDLPEEARSAARRRRQPSWIRPMLATLTHNRFSDKDWIYERKLDGERCLVFHTGKRVTLLSRNRKKLNATYPELVDALEGQAGCRFIADGEVVAFQGNRTSFSRLQGRMQVRNEGEARESNVAVYFYLFDLIHADGHDLSKVPLLHRKALLKKLLNFKDPLRYTPHRRREGETYHKAACRKGWEGVIAKKAEGPYVHGRSRDWLKFKCENQQEFVIGGYTDPKGSRKGFGALLLGYYEEGKLRYAGMVGTGFDDQMLERLKARLETLSRRSSPFDRDDPGPGKEKNYVQPKLVAQVAFTEWTTHKLRHPRFLGLRRDKDPRKVRREKPAG